MKFLIARLFFNDGLITIFALGGIYAKVTLNFSNKELMGIYDGKACEKVSEFEIIP